MYFIGFNDVSYIAYADDILLISRCKSSLSRIVQWAKKGFLDIGLNLNLEKCEYICLNGTSPNTSLQIKNTSIPSVENFRWLGLIICKKCNPSARLQYQKLVKKSDLDTLRLCQTGLSTSKGSGFFAF